MVDQEIIVIVWLRGYDLDSVLLLNIWVALNYVFFFSPAIVIDLI